MTSGSSEHDTAPQPAPRSQRRRRSHLRYLPVAIALLLGVFAGIGFFLFGYGKGASYLSNNPAACANCHVMQEYYDSWQNSSHRHVATCNDCHLSSHKLGKWVTKADNGFFHSLAFTTGQYPDPIQIKPRNQEVAQNACLHCHGEFVHQALPVQNSDDVLRCVRCHSAVGHGHR